MKRKSSVIPPARRAAAKAKIPLYQKEFYSWLYESPRLTRSEERRVGKECDL